MLEGDVPQDKMTCLFFVKEGIRKLIDLNTVIENNTIYFNMWHLDCKDKLVRAGTWTTNKIGKRRVLPCPKGQVAVSEQILSLAIQSTVGVLHREPVAATGSIRLT